MPDLTLTMGRAEDGRLLAIITTGGHPQINPGEDTHVLDVEVVKTKAAGRKWFKRMQVERPWETRQ